MARSFFNLRSSLMETKSAPQGFHFTKDGKLKRGDAGVDGPGGTKLRSDPLDKQRSKIPPVAEAASSHEKNTFYYKPITGASKTSKGHTFVGITSNSEGRKGANILKHKEGGFFAASGSTSKQEGNIHKTPEAAAKAFHAKSNERLKEENTKPSNKLPMHLDPNRPFDPDIPKKNPVAKAGKYGQGFSTAKHLAKQGMASVKKEEASPMIKPPTNEFAKKEDAFAHAKRHGGKVMKKTFTHPTSGMKHVSYVVREELELDEAIKLNSKVIMHAPGKDYHGQTGTVGEIRHGLHDKADKTYTIDYGKGKSIQLQKNNIKLHKEEAQGVAETSDYFRRREREEAIISGQKPARKKQPAQTSDYARRREQENKAKERVEEAGPFSYGYKPPRKGSVAYNALRKRKEQEKNQPPIEPKDQMVGVAKKVKKDSVDESIKSKLAAGALAATLALGAHARVSGDHKDDPNINRLTGKPNVTQSAEKPAETAERREYEKPDKVDRHEGLSHGDVITIHHGGKEYQGHIMPHDGPRIRGGKTLQVPHAMMGIRGLGHYEAQIHPSGYAAIYK